MTLEKAIAALPPMDSAYDIFMAYRRELPGEDRADNAKALELTWAQYRAMQKQQKAYTKGKRE